MFGDQTCVGKAECGSGGHVKVTSSVTSSGARVKEGREDPKGRGNGEGERRKEVLLGSYCVVSPLFCCVCSFLISKTGILSFFLLLSNMDLSE